MKPVVLNIRKESVCPSRQADRVDYQAMEETAYLLSSPVNRAHLEKSLKEEQCAKLFDFPVEDL
jgi:hypothetical protein